MPELFTKEDAFNEGATNVVLDDLATKDDVTLDDLRTLPGAADMSDEELQKAWDDAQKGDAAPATTSAGTGDAAAAGTTPAAPAARSWKYYGADAKEVADLKAYDAFLAGKIGYQANGKEQQKSLDEIIRVAQYGHLNEQRYNTTLAERNTLAKQLQELQPQVEQASAWQKTLTHALDQFTRGNEAPLKAIVEKYAEVSSRAPTTAAPASSPAESSGGDSAAGMQVYYEVVVPGATEVAKRYNVKQEDVTNAIMQRVEQEPAQFLTRERLDQIISQDIPAYIESLGFSSNAAPGVVQPSVTTAANAEVARLQAEIAALKANSVTSSVRARNKKLPDSIGGTGGGGQESGTNDGTVPAEALNDAASFKRFLRS